PACPSLTGRQGTGRDRQGSRLKGDEEPQLEVQSSKLKGKQKDFPLSFELSALSTIAVFLDRDGTINEDVGYLDSTARLKLLPGAAEAIRQINQGQLKAVVLTNQSGVARGYYPEERLKEIHEHLETILAEHGARLDGIYYCIHHPDEGCLCRKPSVGMLEAASRELSIDLSRSYVVGDKVSDIELAHNAGAKGILVLTGHGINDLAGLDPSLPNFVAKDLSEAIRWIIEDVKKEIVV
ncbi:MAG: D-glycero-beta-D-manno-heptose 1,7-bisphosphate 7-phosphatase, partial [Nitrospiria bacterium]